MSDNNMPAVEATVDAAREPAVYELAFHVLPTIAEGEVPEVFASIKSLITSAGGEVIAEEVPQHFELAYEIIKYLEGRNRKFATAYFGWVRFRLSPEALVALTEEVEGKKELLRYLLIKLTRVEEAHPFNFHESIAHKKVRTIVEEEAEVVEEVKEDVAADVAKEEGDGVEKVETV